MSVVVYSPIEPGDARSESRVNSILADLETASASLDARNFAEEGMDGRALEAHPVGELTGVNRVLVRNAATLATSAVFVQLVHNGTALRLSSPADVPVSLAANERLRVRSRIWFETTLAAGFGLTGELNVQLMWNNGAATAKLPFSLRKHYVDVGQGWHAMVATEGWIEGGSAISWVEVQYTLRAAGGGAGGTAFPSASITWATLFNRVAEF